MAPSTEMIFQEKVPSGSSIPLYLGAGCFWRIQTSLALVEAQKLHRPPADITARAGYAGATSVGPNGLVCYHGGPAGSLYETLGYFEAVQVDLDSAAQLEAVLAAFFSDEFVRTAEGRVRRDPQDAGPPYRSGIGLQGGLSSRWIREVPVHIW